MTLAAGLAPTGADVDAPREHDDRRGDRWWIAGAVIAGVLLAALQVREVISLGATYTDQDQTMLWSAGRAMLHGHVYEPNIWGSQYNTVFEGLPTAPSPATPPRASSTSPAADRVMRTLDEAREPLGKAAILERASVPAGEWTSVINSLLTSGAIVREGDKRGAKYRTAL